MIKMPMKIRRVLAAILLLAYLVYFWDKYTEFTFFDVSNIVHENIFVISSLFLAILFFPSVEETREYKRTRREKKSLGR